MFVKLKSFIFVLLLNPLCQAYSFRVACHVVYNSQRTQLTKTETLTISPGKTISLPYGTFFLDISLAPKNQPSPTTSIAEASIWAHKHTVSMAQVPIYLDSETSLIEYNNANTKESLSAECSINRAEDSN